MSESCINNVKLTLNCTKDYSRSRNSHNQNEYPTYTKRSKDRLTRGSLDNVSVNPWGGNFEEESTLRRSRSLAITRDDIFSSLDYFDRPRKRSQLIPRAKLIDKSAARLTRIKGSSVDNLPSCGKNSRRSSYLAPPDYSPPQVNYSHYQPHIKQKSDTYESIRNPEDHRTSPKQQSNSNSKKNSVSSVYRLSYEDLQELSLPNYYPDARYDTDNTDNISLTDNISSVSLDNLSKTKYQSLEDIKFDQKSEHYESIPYDENIVLSTNKNLYDTVENKPRTIRNPTPYHENYGKVNPRSESSEEEKSLEQTDTNLDEIKLNNEHITKSEASSLRAISRNSNIESNPLYESTNPHLIEKDIPTKPEENICERKVQHNSIKTSIEIKADVHEKSTNDDQYKTIVAVGLEDKTTPNEENSCKHKKETKTHSHNYLKEFLESQKGSKKPLQNFIAKKFSNLSRRNSKERSNLKENQFHSLPDISVSKNLRKCEKIDRKLRKCEKGTHLKEASRENRFIVNIGRHFDVTANSSTPVDFELKIAKIPKYNKKNSIPYRAKSDEDLIEAVKNLKETLHGSRLSLDENHNITLGETNTKAQKEMAMLYCQDECEREFREKLGTMRNYWNNMVGNHPNEGNINEKCKIVDVKTKVEEVKKKFENEEKPEDKPQSKVQLAKQLFEPKLGQDRNEKLSPLIKETCNYFENNSYQFEKDPPFQSLCPTSVEIIDSKTKETNNENISDTTKNHKPVTKSNSVCSKPEFDHVRYKVVKSDLFQKKIFANCEKESQFEELIQYLQDYSFHELLVDNNIVIIEPIRSKVPYEPSNYVKSMRNITPRIHKRSESAENQSTLNRPFFYRPIRVNKEVNDSELPNPDTVRQVRQFFEGGLKKSQSSQELHSANKEKLTERMVDPDKDRCSATDSNSHQSNLSDFGSQENLYDSIDNEIYCEYVSEDILEKIRECGTTVTYYGGRIVNHKTGQPVLTKVIMEEIKNDQERCSECSNCRKNSLEGNKDSYLGVKFRILKSNSCSSRLELVGTDNLQDTKKQILNQHKKMANQSNMKKRDSIIKEDEDAIDEKRTEKNVFNENIKQQLKKGSNQPKIIGEEMKTTENKMTQWTEIKNEKTYTTINYSEKNPQKIYDFYNYDKIKTKKKKDDMEFETYEVA